MAGKGSGQEGSEEQNSTMDAKDAVSKFSLGLAEAFCKHEFLILSFSAILYVDCVINIFVRKNISTFSWDSLSFSAHFYRIVLLTIAYSSLVSCILPAFNFLTITVLEYIDRNKYKNRHYNFGSMVTYSSALEFAEFSNNSVLYETCRKIDEHTISCKRISNYSFYVIFFAVLNFAILGDAKNPTILQEIGNINEYFYSIINNSVAESGLASFISAVLSRVMIVMCLILGFFFFAMWKNNSFIDESNRVIVNSRLAKVINADYLEREKKAREANFRPF